MSSISADVVFCDEIRQEITGKFLLIGVYPADLVLATMPAAFPMGMLIRVHGLEPGQHRFSINVAFAGGETVFAQEDVAELSAPDLPLILVFSGFLVPVKHPGFLEARIRVGGDDLTARGRIKVISPPQVNS
jgi:hypothetical protein